MRGGRGSVSEVGSPLLLLLLLLEMEEEHEEEEEGEEEEEDGGRASGVVVVGARLMCWDISSSTEAGVTLSIKVKEGSSKTVVGAEAE